MSVLHFQHLVDLEQGAFVRYLLFVKPPEAFKYFSHGNSFKQPLHVPPPHQASFWFALEVSHLTSIYASLFGISQSKGKAIMTQATKKKAQYIVLEYFAFTNRYNVMFYLVVEAQNRLELDLVPKVQLTHTENHAIKFVFDKDDQQDERCMPPLDPETWRGIEKALRLVPLWQRRLSWALLTLQTEQDFSPLFSVPERRPSSVMESSPQARQKSRVWIKLAEAKEKPPRDVIAALKFWKRQLTVPLASRVERVLFSAIDAANRIIQLEVLINAVRFEDWQKEHMFVPFRSFRLMNTEGKETNVGLLSIRYNVNKCLSVVVLDELTGETEERQHFNEFQTQPTLYLSPPAEPEDASSSQKEQKEKPSSSPSSLSPAAAKEKPSKPATPALALWRTSQLTEFATGKNVRGSKKTRSTLGQTLVATEEGTCLTHVLRHGLKWLSSADASHWVVVYALSDSDVAWREALSLHFLILFLLEWQQSRTLSFGLQWLASRWVFPMVRDIDMLTALCRLTEISRGA